ncbi:MAG: DUF86 domain-containing protein [Chloroflexi bacterium]|nr:DUF86 domain-containing protein [Chloroflexota bacterium]
MADELVQDAVMRNLEIIGEAAKALSTETTIRAPSVAWRSVSGMRDHLVHGYFGVDLDIVWNAIAEDLPGLRSAVEQLLRGADAFWSAYSPNSAACSAAFFSTRSARW